MYVLLVWVFQESVIKMGFDLQVVYWEKLWLKKWEVLEEAGEGTGGEPQYSSEKVLASRIGSPWVKVRGSWSPLSWEQARLSVPVLLSHLLEKRGVSAHTTVRVLRGTFSSCCIHTCGYAYICVGVSTYGYTCTYTYGYACLYICVYVCIYRHRDRYGRIPTRLLHALLWGRFYKKKKKQRSKDCTKTPNIPASYIQLPIRHLKQHQFYHV